MKRKRWARLAGQAIMGMLVPMGAIHFCLPPPSIIRQWPIEGGMWTPEPQLGPRDRRAWAAIEAALRDIEVRR